MFEAVWALPLFLVDLLLVAFETDLIFTVAWIEIFFYFLEGELAYLANVGAPRLALVHRVWLSATPLVEVVTSISIGGATSSSLPTLLKLASLTNMTLAT